MLGGAIAMGVGAFLDPALIASPLYDKLMWSLAIGGISMEAGAIAQALTQQRGMNITTRQPASYRQIVRGCQRVGGVIVYQSTTGGSRNQYNFVIVLAPHQCWAIENLYLDGRRVFWAGGAGNTTRNGYNFGGAANGTQYIGPNGADYNFGGLVYCEARFGDQADGDVISGLTANDPRWAASGGQSPWAGGCCYVYLKVEYDAAMFPQVPEIRFTLHGKCDIYDPRTGLRGYSTNAALHVADILTDPTWGLGDNTVNQDQLIAAANICDETLAAAPTTADPTGSLTEARYAAHWHYDTSTPPGEAIGVFLKAMGGRITRAGGEWFIWPAVWAGPSFTWDENALLEPPQWNAIRKADELYNRVTGTYIAPNYPYNVAGDLYDANGWYYGSIQNNFPFAFQPTNAPQYAVDGQHGYAYDAFLTQDSGATTVYDAALAYPVGSVVQLGASIYRAIAAAGIGIAPVTSAPVWNALIGYTTGQSVTYNGIVYTALASTTDDEPDTSPSSWAATPWIPYGNVLPLEMEQKAVLSVSQWQRLAKIALLRNRQQGSGTLKMKFSTFAMAGIDVFYFNFAALGWSSKLLEAAGEPEFLMEEQDAGDGGKVQSLALRWPVQETDPSVYEWDVSEELTVYDLNPSATAIPYTPVAPTGMTLTSGAATAVVGADGAVTPRVLVAWTDPQDGFVTQIQIQFRPTGGGNPWQNGPTVAVGLGEAYVSGVVAQAAYDFRIRSLRASGATSAWLEDDNYTVSTVLSISSYTGISVAPPGTLIALANSDGTATIEILNFNATYGGIVVSCTPSPNAINGLVQNAAYWVYYIDPTFVGGTITPIATQSESDFLNKAGYLLIGQINTPSYAPLYRPSGYSDIGSRTTQTPAAAYDGNIATNAVVGGSWTTAGAGPYTYPVFIGDCIWNGFAAITTAAAKTLTVLVTPTVLGGTGTWVMQVLLHGLATDPIDLTGVGGFTGTLAEQTLTYTIPSGTNLANVSIELIVTATPPGSPGSGAAQLADAEMWIQ